MKTFYDKLVRDKIPEYLRGKGIKIESRQLENNEIFPLLLEKLIEEASEAKKATPEKLAEEIADILEVLEAITSRAGILESEIDRIKEKKKDERGGFEKGIFLISTTEQD